MAEHGGAAQPRVPLCPEGTMIRGRWRISHQIGMGAFGEIYIAHSTSTQEHVAIKVEVVDEKRQALRAEVAIMRKLQGCPYVCQFISCGRQGNINFLVMELLGGNLSDLRKKQPRGAFSMTTVCRLGCEMVKALHAVHDLGVLHRDVKPSNFVLGGKYKDPSNVNKLYIIDFGLSRKYLSVDGEIKPPRANAGFRGTARYASVNSHQCKELSPRDDLWSVFYLMVEFATGSLPWRNQRDRDKVGEMKLEYMKNKKLTEGLPPEFEQFNQYLQSLDYYTKPDYDKIIRLFHGLLLRILGLPETTVSLPLGQLPPYDWERSAPSSGVASTVSSSAASSNNGEKKMPLFKYHPPKSHNAPVGSLAAGTTGQTTLFEEEDNAHDADGECEANGVPLTPVDSSKQDTHSHAVTQSVTVRDDRNGPILEPEEGGGPVKKEKGCCCNIM